MDERNTLENERIIAIDGLRGICALIVVMSHFMVAFFPAAYWGENLPSHTLYNVDTYLSQSPLAVFYAGNYAVCVFFIISGFVLSRGFYTDDKKMDKIATNRYLRLCIPILISTLIIFIFMKLSLFQSGEVAAITGSQWLNDLYSFDDTFANMIKTTLFDVFFIGNAKYNTVFWMMSILFYGSFFTFLIVKIWGNMRNRQIIYFLLMLILYKLNNLYYIAFILGILCADISVNYKMFIGKISSNVCTIIIIIAGIYLGCYPTGVVPTNIFYHWLNIGDKSFQIYHILGAFLFVLGVVCSQSIQRILAKGIFQYLGKISFSIFLVHIIVLCSFSCSIFSKVWSLTQKYQIAFISTFIPSMIIIIIFAHLFYKVVEQNVNKSISKIYNKIFI